MVYVCRNPKDSAVSFYHFQRLRLADMEEDFDAFADLFKSGTLVYGSYWHHLKVRIISVFEGF